MKKILVLVLLVAFLAGCGGENDSTLQPSPLPYAPPQGAQIIVVATTPPSPNIVPTGTPYGAPTPPAGN